MIPVGVLLALGAGAGWSALDVGRKLLLKDLTAASVLVWLVIGQSIVFAAWVGWDGGWVSAPVKYAPWGAASILLNITANLSYLYALGRSPFSVMVPLLSLVPVFTVAAANPMLGELPSPRQLVGVGAIVLGTLTLGGAIESDDDRGPTGVLRALRRLAKEPGTVPMLVTAACWSLTIIVDKRAMEHAAAPAHALLLSVGVALCLVAWMLLRGRTRELLAARGRGPLVMGAVLAASAGLASQLLALHYLLAGIVEAIKRAIGLISAVVMGRLLFAERVTLPKVGAILLMGLGIALILL